MKSKRKRKGWEEIGRGGKNQPHLEQGYGLELTSTFNTQDPI